MARRGTIFRVYFFDGRWQSKQYTDSHHGSRKFTSHADAIAFARDFMQHPPKNHDAHVTIEETDSHGYTTPQEGWSASGGSSGPWSWSQTRQARTKPPKPERATKASLRKSAKAGGAPAPKKIRIRYQIGKRVV